MLQIKSFSSGNLQSQWLKWEILLHWLEKVVKSERYAGESTIKQKDIMLKELYLIVFWCYNVYLIGWFYVVFLLLFVR